MLRHFSKFTPARQFDRAYSSGFGKFSKKAKANQSPKDSQRPVEPVKDPILENPSADQESESGHKRQEEQKEGESKARSSNAREDNWKKASPKTAPKWSFKVSVSKRPDDDDGQELKPLSQVIMVAAAAAGLYFLLKYLSPGKSTPSGTDWKTLREKVVNHEIDRIQIVEDKTAILRLITGELLQFNIQSGLTFEHQLRQIQAEIGGTQSIPVLYEPPSFFPLSPLLACVPPLLMLFFLTRSKNIMGSMGMNKKKFDFTAASKTKTSFKDVAGLEEPKKEIHELVDFLKHPAKYHALGARIPKGALLVGPPGVGKTLLAKATAGEAGVPFLSITGSDFVEMFVGVGSSRIRDMFKEARKQAPCIVFIDEIDSIGRQRSKGGGGAGRNEERENTLNALLVEMDGFNTSANVIVLAGTNQPQVLDAALLRPGRFDRQIEIQSPPLKDRVEIFMVHLRPLTVDPVLEKEECAKQLAELTAGFSGADIMNCCNEAALIAAREEGEYVNMGHFDQAIYRIVGGLEKKNKVITKWERNVIAHHEAGHAVVGWFSQHVSTLLKVSIQPRANGTLGFAHYMQKDKYIRTMSELFDDMCVALGGRVAEKLIFGHLSTGAADDLRKVTSMAYKQITNFGMSEKVGHVCFPDNTDSYVPHKPYSAATERLIDTAAQEMVDQAYRVTEELLQTKHAQLLELAQLLLQKEVLKTEDIAEVLGERPTPPTRALQLASVSESI
eukprot:NODE_320_length_2415_cov_61.905594_g298_i0.p1 GENE.NODE_320_length_2415_cov_61.905594_g298_i0~~NODE_320_length_2415_cov_61.905594_g298_i0.p1  ORF type:complete len:728 (+),score=214.96 NODE_320_length_2415_cov_61.905594_g298_i0:54-2237(+)